MSNLLFITGHPHILKRVGAVSEDRVDRMMEEGVWMKKRTFSYKLKTV